MKIFNNEEMAKAEASNEAGSSVENVSMAGENCRRNES